jgi:beta-lactamase class A
MKALYLLCLLALVGCSSSSAMHAKVDARIAKAPEGATVAIAFHDYENDKQLCRKLDDVMHAASTMKLPVMIELHRRAAEKTLDLDAPIRVENRFKSIVDGSEFELDPKDDSDEWTFKQLGKDVPVRSLIERMIVRSSNLATNLLIEKADAATVTSTCRALGAPWIQVRRGVEDSKAFKAGLNNETSARDLVALLDALANEKTPGSREMISVLARQELNSGIPAGLPPGTRVAHKTGSITKIWHDAAIVLDGDRPLFSLVILTKGFADPKDAAAMVRDLARIVWEER